MKKTLITISCLLVLCGCSGENEITYRDHLDNAEKSLAEIEQLLEGDLPTAFIPTVYAGGAIDEAKVVDKASEATEEISNAQDKVDKISDQQDRDNAQSEVGETIENAENVLSAAEAAMQNEEFKNELEKLGTELDDIQPLPENEEAKSTDDNNPDDEGMEAESNTDDSQDSANEAGNNGANPAAEAATARQGTNPDTNNKENYEAFKKATGVNFQPIYDGTGDSPLDKPADNMMQDAAQDLRDRANVKDPGQMDAPMMDEAAIQRAMEEMAQ